MNSRTQRRDDRSAADLFKQWVPADSKYNHDYDSERRRNRSATVPSNSYDPRSYPSQDTRYNDPRQPPRTYRQDPHHPPAAPHPTSHHHVSAQAPSTNRAYQHSMRTAQHSSSGYHYPQPSSFQPSHSTPAYPVASSSRRPYPEASDPRSSKRTAAVPVQQTYEHISSGEEMPRPSRHASRPLHSSTHPPTSAPSNQAFWNPTQDMTSSRRHKDSYPQRERDHGRGMEGERERERERERDKPTAEPENRYKDRARAERYRERERERAPEPRYQEPSRTRPYDKRKDSDTEGPSYPDPRSASKVSLTGKEGYSTATREPSSGHRRNRTEDGTTSTGRRHQSENMQNPITTMPSQSTGVPQPDVQQTGEPPPAPRVMPVYLPSKAKSQRSHRDGRPSTAQGAQSGSDTERATGKHRMERAPSGPAVQRSDAHTSSSTRDRSNHDVQVGPRDDARRLEGKYGAHQDIRQPLATINVDIPLVTPGFNASTLPPETRPPIAQQIVSIHAGQGPSDPHDAHLKSSAILHSGAPQDIDIHPPHPPSASIVKAPSRTRLQSSETRAQPDRPAVLERSRTEPHVGDLPPGQRMSIHEPRAMPIPISKPSRGNPEIGADNLSSSHPHSRPPSRSAHRTSVNSTAPPAVAGPRPLRSTSQGPQTNEPPTRPPSVAQHGPTSSSFPNQQSVPQPSVYPTNGSPSRTVHAHGSLSSAQPSPKNAQLHSVTLSHSTSTQHAPSAPPSAHQTPVIVSQAIASSSRPSTRDGAYANASTAHHQSADRQSTADIRPGLRQASNSTTLEAAWVVQTPATVRKARISREDKYLRDHRFNSETPHPQLRQVLSQDDDPFPRASSSMMKASQATTPTTSSQRNSPGTKSRDVPFGTPRGTSASNSPRYGPTKEAPTPDHIPRQNLLPHVAGPPQIAIVGATPVAMVRELPQGRVDHGLLAPFPAPARTSRTTSSSQDQLPQPAQPGVGITPSISHQPPLAPMVRAPSLFQPYRPPSLPIAEDNGQFSPPPIPIPPPKGLEDSPPPPMETRTSEIIPMRSQNYEPFQSYAPSVPEVQSEMFHLPSQPPAPSLLPSMPPPHPAHNVPPSKPDNNTGPIPMLDGADVAQAEAKLSKPAFSQPDDVPVVHHEIMLSVPVLPSQPLPPPARLRPKVTIEDVPEDSPVSTKPVTATAPAVTPPVLESRSVQPSHPTTLAKANSSSQSAVVDQPTHRHSPQTNNKDSPLYRVAEPSTMPTAPPMPPPPPTAAPMSARVPSYAPPPQATSFPSAPAVPAQRAANTGLSRTYQRAAEMLQTSKLSTSSGTNPGAIRYVNKSAAAPVQTVYNSAISVSGQYQPVNSVSVQGPSSSRPVYATTAATLPTASATASIQKATTYTTTIGPSPPGGGSGPYISAPANNGVNIPPPSITDARQQPSRPGPLSMPSVDAPPLSVPSTIAVRNPHQEQPIVDPTRPRDIPSATRPIPPSSHTYPTATRPSTSSATIQPTHVTPAQPPIHHRVASLPTTSLSSAAQKPPSPRKYSQPLPSTSFSTQPFPSRPPAPESRTPVSAPVFTPAPVRSERLPFPGRANDPDMLNTPSSIAPSPMLNPDTSNVVPQPMAVPIRTRKLSTDSKDDKKKPGIFGTIFRTRTLSSKAAEPPAVSTATRASIDQGKVQHPDISVVTPTPVPRGVTSTSAPKEPSSSVPPTASASFYARSQAKPKAREPNPIVFPPPTQAPREHRDTTPHIFTPFKFLHSKRNRTVSAASLDVCDGNTATNTVIGSPDHSTLGQAQPLPPIITPGIRDPLIAASEWRDREEAERRERRTHRIRRPGVTFDLEEEPPSPAPGAANRRKRLIRRGSGRTPTPGPPRG